MADSRWGDTLDPFRTTTRGFLVAWSSLQPALLVDESARIRFVNQAAVACFHLSPQEAALRPLEVVLPVCPASLGIGAQNPRTAQLRELRAQNREGSPFLVHPICFPLEGVFLLLLKTDRQGANRQIAASARRWHKIGPCTPGRPHDR